VVFTVEDTGDGIPIENRKVFEPFFTTKPMLPNHLMLAKKFVERNAARRSPRHQAKIDVSFLATIELSS
jgi:hypothetical protein